MSNKPTLAERVLQSNYYNLNKTAMLLETIVLGPHQLNKINKGLTISYKGRLSESVESTLPYDITEINPELITLFVPKEIKQVTKKNKDERLTQIEGKILNNLIREGVRVPKVLSSNGKTLELEWIDGNSLKDYVFYQYFNINFEINKEKIQKIMNDISNVFYSLMEISAKIDYEIPRILTEDEKLYLKNKKIESLVDTFGISKEEATKKYNTYWLMQGLGINDNKFVELFEPIESIIKEKLSHYITWVSGFSRRNVIIDKENNVYAFDFNNPHEALLQTTDSLLIDSYLPIKDFRYFDISPSILSIEDKVNLLKDKYIAWCELNGKKPDNFDNYKLGYLIASIIRTTRQFCHAVKEAGVTPYYQEMYDLVMEASLCRQNVIDYLGVLSKKTNLDFTPLSSYLDERFRQMIGENVSQSEWNECLAYLKSDSEESFFKNLNDINTSLQAEVQKGQKLD